MAEEVRMTEVRVYQVRAPVVGDVEVRAWIIGPPHAWKVGDELEIPERPPRFDQPRPGCPKARVLSVAATTTEDDSYEGGRDGWHVDSKFGDIHLTFTETTGSTHAQVVRRLGDEDLDDLELALRAARSARDNYRARRAG